MRENCMHASAQGCWIATALIATASVAPSQQRDIELSKLKIFQVCAPVAQIKHLSVFPTPLGHMWLNILRFSKGISMPARYFYILPNVALIQLRNFNFLLYVTFVNSPLITS